MRMHESESDMRKKNGSEIGKGMGERNGGNGRDMRKRNGREE